jgi:hypothetical protein
MMSTSSHAGRAGWESGNTLVRKCERLLDGLGNLCLLVDLTNECW